MLPSKANEVLDITNILDPLGLESSHAEQAATEASKGLHVLVNIGGQVSGVPKEAHGKTVHYAPWRC